MTIKVSPATRCNFNDSSTLYGFMISIERLTDVFFSFFHISGHESEARIRSSGRVKNLSLLTRMICLYGRLEVEKNHSISCIRVIIPHKSQCG